MVGVDTTAGSGGRSESYCVSIMYHRTMMRDVGNECSPATGILCIVRTYGIPRVRAIDLTYVQHEMGLCRWGNPLVHCQRPLCS